MRNRVCPRCLGVTPGIAAGTPDKPHPGPFTRELCRPCEQRINQINHQLLSNTAEVLTDAADNTGDFT